MVTELIVVGSTPLDLLHLVTGTARVDPEFGLRSVLDDGATQIVDREGATLVTVFRCRGIEVPSEILRLVGTSSPDWHFWTEAFVPDGAPGLEVLEGIAREASSVVLTPRRVQPR
jgi:hypothetical protein